MFVAAEKLEKTIRQGGEVDATTLKAFSVVVGNQVGAIRSAMENVTAGKESIEESHLDFDPEAASAAIERLRILLESSDGNAAEAFLPLERMLAGTVDTSRLDALNTTIAEFDFEAALKELEKIAESFGTIHVTV